MGQHDGSVYQGMIFEWLHSERKEWTSANVICSLSHTHTNSVNGKKWQLHPIFHPETQEAKGPKRLRCLAKLEDSSDPYLILYKQETITYLEETLQKSCLQIAQGPCWMKLLWVFSHAGVRLLGDVPALESPALPCMTLHPWPYR